MLSMKTDSMRAKCIWVVAMSLVVSIAFMPSMVSAGTSNNWQLLVKSAACVQGPDVLLGEIADPITSMDQRTWDTISSIKLWKAATKPGRPVTVSKEKLRDILEYYIGDQVNKLVLPQQLTVQTGGRVIESGELKSMVVAFLTPRASDLSGEVEFKNFKLPSDMFFKNSTDELLIDLNGDLKPGHNQFKLHGVASDGKVVFRKAGTVFLNVWKAVPVASKPLNRFERVTQDKVSFQRVNLAYMQDTWDGTGGPWRMTRTLGRNQPFTQSHLEQIPLIEKGELVQLVFKGKKIQLSIKVESLGEASMGQQVAVRNLQSKKTILATVVGDDLVMVQ